MPTFGLEEEVFVLEPDLPSLNSLYYLSRLLWKDPKLNYKLTASNFSRGSDVRQALMSGVEVATRVHDDPDELVDDLAGRRADLSAVSEGLIAPIGHLINLSTPTNVCALQLHVGGVNDISVAYGNLVHFLPVLNLLAINAPYAGGVYFGQSFRLAHGYSVGKLKDDPYYRFQDIIISKRLGTIELRSPDPVWDLARIRVLARAVAAIAELKEPLGFSREAYNSVRDGVAKEGYTEMLRPLYNELKQIAEVPENMLEKTASDDVKEFFEANGMAKTYSALDNGYREGVFAARELPVSKASSLRSLAGLAGYYVPKFPYVVWKYLKEK